MLSQAAEDYIKAIYKLQSKGTVTTNEIARAIDVSSASVTNMLKRLADMKLLDYTSYKGVTLSNAGEKIALEVLRHHRLIELYLSEVMGYSWDEVHDEAERLEHHISEMFEDKIYKMLGYPEFDPHGDPIPGKDGSIEDFRFSPLSKIEPGNKVTIKRVSDKNPEMLRYLTEIGLVLEITMEVLDKAPFEGPLTVKIGDKEQMVWREVAKNVYVAPVNHEADKKPSE